MQEISLNQIQSCEADNEIISCCLCDMKSRNLVSHITRKHNISIKNYKEKFPNSQVLILSKEAIEKIKKKKNEKITKNKQNKERQNRRVQNFINSGGVLLQCRFCDKTSAFSLIGHIKAKHDLTEYRNLFPNDIIQRASIEQKQTNSQAMKDKLKNDEQYKKFLDWRSFPSEIKHWLKKGYTYIEAIEKVKEFQREQSIKARNPNTKKKRSEKNSGISNPMSLFSISKRNNISIEEASKLTPCYGRVGKKHPMHGKKHTLDAIEKIANSWHLKNPNYRSKNEIEISDFCNTFAEIESNVRISKWNVDILFKDKKLIIEFFGDYWHMTPKKYKSTDIHNVMKKTAKEIWDRDYEKIENLKSCGYTIIIIWENEWKRDRKEVEKRIKNVYYN